MASAPELTMSIEEYDRWSWTVEDRTEWANGKVIFMMTESERDEGARFFLQAVLGIYGEEKKLGIVRGPNLQIRPPAGSRRVPDVMFISRLDLPKLHPTYVEGGPTVAVEIVSDDSDERDRVDKFREYQEAGIDEYWILDVRMRRFDAFALDSAGRYQAMPVEHGMFRSRALPDFWLRTSWLWDPDRPTILNVLAEMGIR